MSDLPQLTGAGHRSAGKLLVQASLHQRKLSCRLRVIVGVLKAPDGDRFIVVSEHAPENLIYDPHFLGMERSPDFILIQVTSTVGNNKEAKLAFFRYIADELNSKLGVRPDDVMINLVFVQREDWSFGNGDPWN
jgi:hypothetical protein